MENTVFDTKEAAAYLKVHYETLLKDARRGEIPHFKVGRKVLLDEFIRKQEERSSRASRTEC